MRKRFVKLHSESGVLLALDLQTREYIVFEKQPSGFLQETDRAFTVCRRLRSHFSDPFAIAEKMRVLRRMALFVQD